MLGEASISISQHPNVVAFVNQKISDGSGVGAIFPQPPVATQAIDDLTLALARHVLKTIAKDTTDHPPRDKWLQSAYKMIDADQPPLPTGYSAATNVDRLIRWIDPKCDHMLIGVIPELDAAGLLDIRKVADWMNGASQMPIQIVHGKTEAPKRKHTALRSSLEKALWARLQRDPELRGLFEPNVTILTSFQTRPCVDFLWRKGFMIVEIDSYIYHSGRESFAGDRQRDYETGVSGYLTLRLTDSEISTDINLAIQKIRRYVQIRKKIFYV